MFSLDETGGRVAIVQMNAELRHAQLEMLSAQCATDRLRLRYSSKDIATHAHRDTLRKAWASANALFEFYGAIIKQLPDRDTRGGILSLTEANMLDSSDRLVRYWHQQQEHFRPLSFPLSDDQRLSMLPFFSPALLDQIRLAKVDPQRLPNAPFPADTRSSAVTPECSHAATLSFEDIIVFHSALTSRNLFHALVHSVQFEVLGAQQYAELFVSGFLRTRSLANIPLEVHASMLETAFAEGPAQPFSVEEKVRLWANQGRYSHS